MVNRIYLSLGSNIEPEKNLPAAVRLLKDFGNVESVSTVWETPPLGYADQANFLNAAVLVITHLSAEEFQETAIRQIEMELGRVRSGQKFGPRTIDVDIMLFNDEILQIGHRNIPSPEILERAFVAIPLAEIDPDYQHPNTKQSLSEISELFDQTKAQMKRRDDVTP
jgi:2-amino-4-hydroxy-6-hydroxymethyldihydropteridine diphosphokinase